MFHALFPASYAVRTRAHCSFLLLLQLLAEASVAGMMARSAVRSNVFFPGMRPKRRASTMHIRFPSWVSLHQCQHTPVGRHTAAASLLRLTPSPVQGTLSRVSLPWWHDLLS